jgi:ribosomal-protein-alanine N-acetyltransferase
MAAISLATRRLRLRPAALGDADTLHALFTDPLVRRWLWDDRLIPRRQTLEVIEAGTASFAAHGFGYWVLLRAGDDVLIGFCGLRVVDDGPEVELLYGLAPDRWGEGLATEASEAVLAYAFGTLGLARVVARTDTPNRASARVMERLGMAFERETTIGDLPTLCYVMTREAFGARRR